MLTAERLKQVAAYDPETGLFVRKELVRGSHIGAVMGHKMTHGYVTIQVDGRQYLAHRLAWLYMTGEWPKKPYIDHINHDPSDNRWVNLREATQSQQNANQGRRKNNSSGYRGVSWSDRPRGWRARICLNGEQTLLGIFQNIEDAKWVYDQAAKKYFGEFVRAA